MWRYEEARSWWDADADADADADEAGEEEEEDMEGVGSTRMRSLMTLRNETGRECTLLHSRYVAFRRGHWFVRPSMSMESLGSSASVSEA